MEQFDSNVLYDFLEDDSNFICDNLDQVIGCGCETIISGKCTKGHEISRKAYYLLINYCKNNGIFLCQECLKINREIKTNTKDRAYKPYPEVDNECFYLIYDNELKRRVRWHRLKEPYHGYRVSEYGKIEGKYGLLKPENVDGYERVALAYDHKKVNGKTKALTNHLTCHELVSLCFLDGKDKKYLIEHKDDVKNNNHYSNLQYGTSKTNGKKPLNIKSKYGFGKITMINEKGKEICFDNREECIKELNITEEEYFKRVKNFELLENGDDRDMEGEVWVNVVVDGINIRCSNMGRIHPRRGYKTRGTMRKSYYSYKSIHVNRIIAYAFLPVPNDHKNMVVDHIIDDRKWDNSVKNLQWLTTQENTLKTSYKHMKTVGQYRGDELIALYPSFKEAEMHTGVNADAIGMAIKTLTKEGTSRYAGGFIWKKESKIYQTWKKEGLSNDEFKFRVYKNQDTNKKIVSKFEVISGKKGEKLILKFVKDYKSKTEAYTEEKLTRTTFGINVEKGYCINGCFYINKDKIQEFVDNGLIEII